MTQEPENDEQAQLRREERARQFQARLHANLERHAENIRMARETAVSFPIDARSSEFASWLVANTADTGGWKFPAGQGYYQLTQGDARPHPWPDYEGPIVVTIPCYQYVDRENVMQLITIGLVPAITFNILPRSAGRLQVQAQCHVPEVFAYFEKKLQDIGYWFDEAGLANRAPTVQETPQSAPKKRATGKAAMYEDICEERRAGELVKNIARKHGVTTNRIYQILRTKCPDVPGEDSVI